ncbi:hypothetical protein Glove_84g176 [Diversispora epigaea]|uniref:Uncharacterized protein n=1 Tax=Diversispora epigaea TaxID=1348612 RepID=A0A397JE39_9GLOM|nr:hypothetical protein Glove_84g176 [Diversispora epigaea]
MFELIINEYLENTKCKDWTIIGILKYIESKSQMSTDIIETLKTEIYSALQNFRDSHNIHIHENAKNKARKFLTSFDKLFSSANVNNFIDELELKDEKREFHLTVRRNVTSSNTLQALEEHRSTRKEIEEIRNTNVNEIAISVDDESGQDNEKEKGTQELGTLDLTSESQIEKEFEPKLWVELIADRPATANPECHEEIESICDHLFGPLCKKKQPKLYESRDKWENLRNLKAPEYNNGLSYEKGDWKRILYWAGRAVRPFLDAFESEYNPIQQIDCGEREWFGDYIIPIFQGALKLNTSCRVPWGEVTVIATVRRRNQDRNILEYQLDRGHLADLLCKINQQEVVCGLGCGVPLFLSMYCTPDERKNKNTEYHDIPGSSRVDFWNSISNTINERFRTSYKDINLGVKPGAGERYFEEFSSHFWERPETSFDILHNANTSTRRRYRNRTPPSTYRGVLPIKDENNAGENPTHNNIRDFSSNNSANNTSTHNADMPALQNDSDVSMPDIRGSQSHSHMESINEEER